MGKAIGGAGDFYRLRVIHMDESDGPDLEWRDDILYRRPPSEVPDEYDVWRVEAVDVDDDERGTLLCAFPSAEQAREWMDAASVDLAVMTRSEFELTYFPGPEQAEASGQG